MSWSSLLEEYRTRSWSSRAAVARERLLASETMAGRGVKNKS